MKADGGFTDATARINRQGLSKGGSPGKIARGCGKVRRRKATTHVMMA